MGIKTQLAAKQETIKELPKLVKGKRTDEIYLVSHMAGNCLCGVRITGTDERQVNSMLGSPENFIDYNEPVTITNT